MCRWSEAFPFLPAGFSGVALSPILAIQHSCRRRARRYNSPDIALALQNFSVA